VKKKTNRKSGSVKSVKNLPAKSVKAKTAKGVKGGVDFTYGAIEWTYTKQKPSGSTSEK
jgi:type VI protein secretion system component Hcp